MSYLLCPSTMYIEKGKLEGACVRTENDIISAVGFKERNNNDQVINLDGLTLMPGFLDIHMHGGNGYDSMDGTYESINELSKYKLREGVTTFCPTTATADTEKTEAAIINIDNAMSKGVDGAKIAGIFLEGPYLNKEYRGAHEEILLREISLIEIKRLITLRKGAVISFAIAPGMRKALDATRLLRDYEINVRLGHTAATYDESCACINAGGNIAIHTYNAMSPLNHREPGMAGATLARSDMYAEIICDFVHVHPAAIKILYDVKTADKTILITDCMMAGGLSDGEYGLGAKKVIVKDSVARTAEGALAGSTLTIAKAFVNLHQKLGIKYADLIKMASSTPAKALKLYNNIGSITEGKKADIIGMDKDCEVKFVMVDGKIKMMEGELI